MAETNANKTRQFKARHRGRGAQVWIYLGKLLRMFIYQSDWKVLPMSALIAGLVGMVIRRRMFINMEGTLMGAFALVCVCIWNGCFNSIQVICRERDVIKREHRSGMHISSYIFSHMLYQLLLCIAQTGVTLYVTQKVGVKYPMEGLITPFLIVDMGISMLLITYASDMLSLWVSALARTTTTAMTIMPFVLIFQLVFSGGMLSLPEWTEPLTWFTISNPGLKVIAAQADTNNRPFVTISNMIGKMRDKEITITVSVGQVLDLLEDKDNPTIAEFRAKEVGRTFTLEELLNLVNDLGVAQTSEGQEATSASSVVDKLKSLGLTGILDQYKDTELGGVTTVGKLMDQLTSNDEIQAHRDDAFTMSTTLGTLLDIAGEDNVKSYIEQRAAESSYVADYENTEANIIDYWFHLLAFVIAFAMLATITLEFIDKDKR